MGRRRENPQISKSLSPQAIVSPDLREEGITSEKGEKQTTN
jgi:hypothetical protein